MVIQVGLNKSVVRKLFKNVYSFFELLQITKAREFRSVETGSNNYISGFRYSSVYNRPQYRGYVI